MIKTTKEGLKVLRDINGQDVLFIDSSRLDDCIDYLYKNDLRTITINSYQGYKLNNLDFLEGLSGFLEGLFILETHYDYTVINKIHSLKQLGFGDNGKDIIDLNNFPKLEVYAGDFSPRVLNLSKCRNLKLLSLSDYKPETFDLSELPYLECLEELRFIQPKIGSLEGIGINKNIAKLQIFMASKLRTIKALVALKNSLKELEIQKCKKIGDFGFIGELRSLHRLIISESGEMETLKFVQNLEKLKLLSFWGTKVIDGDLSVCQGIDFVGFDNKRHYSHKFEHFKK